MLNVLLDHLLIEPKGGGEISDAPNIAIEVHFSNKPELLLKLGAEIGLENLHHLGNSNMWRDLNLKVEMVFIDVERMDVERRIFLGDGVEGTDEGVFDIGLQELPSVFCTPDDVILVLVGAMVEALNSHAGIVSRRCAVLRSRDHSSPH